MGTKKIHQGLTALKFLKLEDELEDLWKKVLDDVTKAAAIDSRIKEICRLLCPNPDEKVFPLNLNRGDEFYLLFRNRLRSNADFAEYVAARHRAWAVVAERPARKQNENLQDLNSRRWDHSGRNRQMAREFRQRKPTSDVSDTALKAEIGRKRGLARSASIDAINEGLRSLDKESGRS
jgi:hypothetical protein